MMWLCFLKFVTPADFVTPLDNADKDERQNKYWACDKKDLYSEVLVPPCQIAHPDLCWDVDSKKE